jgi:transcriptional regulator with XRE-family HTH domain
MKMTIGERIKAVRKQAGMTQQELADRLGISYVGISNWESGKRKPKQETLERIAAVLDVPLGVLTNTHYMGEMELSEFVNRAWPRADNHLKEARQEGDPEEIERWERMCAELLKIKDEIVREHNRLPEHEEVLLETFRRLNPKGQQKILDLVSDYAKIPEYLSPNGD